MAETTLRKFVCEALKPLHAVAVENLCGTGTPDVCCVLGWIELKQLKAAPARPETNVTIDHYTTDQRRWAEAHRTAGGMCWMLLQVGQEYMIFDGATAATLIGQVPMRTLYNEALYTWTSKPTKDALLNAMIALYKPWNLSSLRRAKNFVSRDAGKTGA